MQCKTVKINAQYTHMSMEYVCGVYMTLEHCIAGCIERDHTYILINGKLERFAMSFDEREEGHNISIRNVV